MGFGASDPELFRGQLHGQLREGEGQTRGHPALSQMVVSPETNSFCLIC